MSAETPIHLATSIGLIAAALSLLDARRVLRDLSAEVRRLRAEQAQHALDAMCGANKGARWEG